MQLRMTMMINLQCAILPWTMCSSPSILGYLTIEDSHLAIKHWYVSMKNVWSTAMNRDLTNRWWLYHGKRGYDRIHTMDMGLWVSKLAMLTSVKLTGVTRVSILKFFLANDSLFYQLKYLSSSVIYCWLVVWNMFYFSIYWECHRPNWLSYFSEG